MTFLKLVLLAVTFISVSNAMAIEWVLHKTVSFPVNQQTIRPGEIYNGYAYVTPAQAKTLWNKEVDGFNAMAGADGKLLLLKSAFIVNHGIRQLSNPALYTPEMVTRLVPSIKTLRKMPNGDLQGTTPLPNLPLLPPDMTFNARFKTIATPGPSALDTQLGVPAFISIQSLFNFNVLMDTANSVLRYYPLGSGTTLVVSYQTFQIRQSAIAKAQKIPFFNLRDQLLNKTRTELKDLVENFNRMNLE